MSSVHPPSPTQRTATTSTRFTGKRTRSKYNTFVFPSLCPTPCTISPYPQPRVYEDNLRIMIYVFIFRSLQVPAHIYAKLRNNWCKLQIIIGYWILFILDSVYHRTDSPLGQNWVLRPLKSGISKSCIKRRKTCYLFLPNDTTKFYKYCQLRISNKRLVHCILKDGKN